MDSNTTIEAAQGINSSNKTQVGTAILIQQYCNSVKMQPNVDLSGTPNLAPMQSQLNTGLKTAQDHASDYLNNIQPNIIKNITSIDNYYALHNSISAVCPPGTSKEDWITALTALRDQSVGYQNDASNVLSSLQTLHSNLTTDAAAFAGFVVSLNAAVNGDQGILASDKTELDTLQSKIDGAIAGIVLSGLAIVGGVFMVAVGGIADFVTAGTSTPLVVAGLVVVVAGVGGEVASAIILNSLNDQKAKILLRDSSLKSEVTLASGISSGYTSLGNQLKLAVDAASAMENAWNFLSNDLGSLIGDLNKGIINDGILQKMFLTAANTAVQTVISDVTIIKSQMTGVAVVPVAAGQTVGQAMIAAVNKQAA